MNYTWSVDRTTTDKLDELLNDLAWDIHQIQYVGGRDWVIISRQIAPDRPNPADELWDGTARRSRSNKHWEINIPDVGRTQAETADTIDQMAKELVAVTFGLAVEDIDVDIEVDTRMR